MSSKEKFILAIDLGTSGPKVALVSTQGELIGSEFEETRLLLSPGGGAEQSPGEWWDAIQKAAKRLLAKGLVSNDDIVAIASTGQWSGTVAVDEGGNALGNAVIWMDTRGAPYIHQIVDGPLKVEGYALAKLLKWIRLTGGAPGKAGQGSDRAHPISQTRTSGNLSTHIQISRADRLHRPASDRPVCRVVQFDHIVLADG